MIEIIIVIAVILISAEGFIQIQRASAKLLRSTRENMEATFVAEEGVEAMRAVRDESWSNISTLADDTNYYPVVQNSKWSLNISVPPLVNGKYNRVVYFNQVFRDAQDKIAVSGTPDAETRKVTVVVSWTGESGGNKQIILNTYLTDFQHYLKSPSEAKIISFEDAATDADLCNFPSSNLGEGDPAQSFTVGSSALQMTKAELLLRSTINNASSIYAEVRVSPTGTILGTSGIINSTTLATTSPAWVEFRFPDFVPLATSTKYYLRLRSLPDSTLAGSGSTGPIDWVYRQGLAGQFSGGEASCYIGRNSSPSDEGQVLDQYDFGFKIYDLQ